MSEPAAREKIGQGLFKTAAGCRDAAAVVERLAAVGVDDERVEELAGLMRRAGALILQRHDAQAQTARDGFLAAVRQALVAQTPQANLQPFDNTVASIRFAEDGHLRILATLERCEISRRPLPVRLSAAFTRAEHRLGELTATMEAALQAGGPLVVPGGVPLSDVQGEPQSADALLTSIVSGLGGALKMEAHKEGLFTTAGWIELPPLTPASAEDLLLYTPSEVLGICWQRWELLHRKAHYGDQVITVVKGGDLPADCPPQITQMYTRPGDANFVDWASNERALDREGISHMNLVVATDVRRKAKGISGVVAALPAEWISGEEVAQCLSLSEAVGFNIAEDATRYAGLTLTQWVRGYTALSAWAEAQAAASPGILRTNPQALVDLLTRLSLSAAEADSFLSAVSFGRKSRDLWDAPIVRTQTDWLVVGAGVAGQRLAKIIPSLLASKDIQIKRKGAAFEQRVIEFLRGQGLDARAVTVWREKAEYQYDVLVPWDGRLLLIECKNHGLSGNDPAQAYHFAQGLEGDLAQVERLKNGLDRWPEIVTDEFGPEAAGLEVIPILLENETFSLPGPLDGAYIYDWSALTRFFEAGWFRVSHDHQIAEGVTVRNRVAVKQIWAGETPTVDDLLAEMANPHQLTVLDHHSRVIPSVFSLDEETLACDWSIVRDSATVESLAAACGVSAEAISARLKEVDEAILSAKHARSRGLVPKLCKRAKRRQAGRIRGPRKRR